MKSLPEPSRDTEKTMKSPISINFGTSALAIPQSNHQINKHSLCRPMFFFSMKNEND